MIFNLHISIHNFLQKNNITSGGFCMAIYVCILQRYSWLNSQHFHNFLVDVAERTSAFVDRLQHPHDAIIGDPNRHAEYGCGAVTWRFISTDGAGKKEIIIDWDKWSVD